MKDRHTQKSPQDNYVQEHLVICGECGESFQSGVDYDYHLTNCNLEMNTEKQYTCSVCVQKFSMLTDVWLHIAREHEKRFVNQDKLIINLLAEQNLQLKEEFLSFKTEVSEAIKFVGEQMFKFSKEVREYMQKAITLIKDTVLRDTRQQEEKQEEILKVILR